MNCDECGAKICSTCDSRRAHVAMELEKQRKQISFVELCLAAQRQEDEQEARAREALARLKEKFLRAISYPWETCSESKGD